MKIAALTDSGIVNLGSKTMDFDCPKASYVVTAEGMFYAKHKRGMVTHAKWNDEALQTQVLSFLQKQVLPFCPCGEISLYIPQQV